VKDDIAWHRLLNVPWLVASGSFQIPLGVVAARQAPVHVDILFSGQPQREVLRVTWIYYPRKSGTLERMANYCKGW